MQDVSAYLHSYHFLGFAGEMDIKNNIYSLSLPPKLQSCMEESLEPWRLFSLKIFLVKKHHFFINNIFVRTTSLFFVVEIDDSIATS